VVFDVATVKPDRLLVTPGAPGNKVFHLGVRMKDLSHGVFACDYCTVGLMISYAYEVKKDQISGSPWLFEDTFEIDARMPPDTPEEKIHLMVQNLLGERFGLRLHHETKAVNSYALVLAGSKPKIEKADSEVKRFVFTPGEMDYNGIGMAEFAHQISSRIGFPVVDKTALEGFYRIKVKWENPQADKGPDSEISGAVKDQLGLALKPEKVEADLLVVDKANKTPSAN